MPLLAPVAESDEQREQRAVDLARAQGRREAVTEAQIESHEKRLNAINGSIDRTGNRLEALSREVGSLRDALESFAGKMQTRDAVSDALRKEVATANEKQISNRTFWLGVAVVVVAIAGLVLSVILQAPVK